MNNIFRKNLESLKEENRDIKDFLLKYNGETETEIIADVTEILGKQVLYAVKENHQYQLDSMYDSDIFLCKWFEQCTNRNFRSRYILFGFGNGMYVNKILHEVGEEAVVLILEPSHNIFQKVLKEFDVSDLLSNKQMHLILEGVSKQNFLDLLREYMVYDDIYGTICRVYLNYGKLFFDSNEKFDRDVKFHCNSLEAAHTVVERMGYAYYCNTMSNYLEMVNGKSLIALNKNIPKDIPAFIISSGPSLDKNILELKKVKNRGFIVAADSAVGALLKNDIVPDLMMTIDAFKLPQHFKHERINEIPLVCSLACSCELLECHKGDKYFVNDDNAYVEAFYQKINKVFPKLTSGGSVATSIFALLESMKFEKIVLVGQDLAFLNNKMYADDTVRGKQQVNKEELNTIYLEGINGEQILSSYEFQIYLNWFEEEIEMNKKIHVIDATEGGALIHGTEIQTLSEVIEQECTKEVDINAIMKKITDRFTVEEKKCYINHMNDLPNELRKIETKISDQMLLIEEMEKLIVNNEIISCEMQTKLKKAGEIGAKIEEKGAFYYLINYIQRFIRNAFKEDMYKSESGNVNEIKTMVNQLKTYYSIMYKHIPAIIENVELRIKSCKEDKNDTYESKNG